MEYVTIPRYISPKRCGLYAHVYEWSQRSNCFNTMQQLMKGEIITHCDTSLYLKLSFVFFPPLTAPSPIVSATFSERGPSCVSGDAHHGRSTGGGGLISPSTDNNEPDHHRGPFLKRKHTQYVYRWKKIACRNITQRKESMPKKGSSLTDNSFYMFNIIV